MTSPPGIPPPPPSSPSDAAALLDYLKTHDAYCPLCKYNLRNLSVPRCPECGRAVRLTVGLVEQNIVWYVVLLVSQLLPTGMAIVAWIAFVREGPRLLHMGPLEAVSFTGFLLSVFPTAAAIFFRRRFLRMNDSRQKLLALVSFLEPITLYVLLFLGSF
jgi:hypothetical protein